MNFFYNKTKKILNNEPTYTQESGSEKISLPLSLINTSIYAYRSAIGILSVCIRAPHFIRLLLLAKYATIKHYFFTSSVVKLRTTFTSALKRSRLQINTLIALSTYNTG